MVTPAAMPATVVVHLGVGAIPAVVMTTALDDDGPGAGNRRQRHRHRTESRERKSKLSHIVLLTIVRMQPPMRRNVPQELQEFSEQLFSQLVAVRAKAKVAKQPNAK
jgi:hypothetical protein